MIHTYIPVQSFCTAFAAGSAQCEPRSADFLAGARIANLEARTSWYRRENLEAQISQGARRFATCERMYITVRSHMCALIRAPLHTCALVCAARMCTCPIVCALTQDLVRSFTCARSHSSHAYVCCCIRVLSYARSHRYALTSMALLSALTLIYRPNIGACRCALLRVQLFARSHTCAHSYPCPHVCAPSGGLFSRTLCPHLRTLI